MQFILPTHWYHLRVLVVHPDPVCCSLLTESLEHLVADCTSVPNGPLALITLQRAWERQQPFHVALIEYHMPGLSGPELARFIQIQPHLQSVRIIPTHMAPSAACPPFRAENISQVLSLELQDVVAHTASAA